MKKKQYRSLRWFLQERLLFVGYGKYNVFVIDLIWKQ